MAGQNNQDDQLARPCWIDTIDPADADPELRQMYRQVGETHNRIHNLYRAFSLQPQPLISADQHYRAVLHNEKNVSAPWLLELLASQAAIIAHCDYALANHGANFKVLLGDAVRGERMLAAVREDRFDDPTLFDGKVAALLAFGAKLCRSPHAMSEDDIEVLRSAGVSDTEILEAVQASACFAYWVRFINALGIRLGEETAGRYGEP